jgi:hypothetical protein
MIVKYCLLQSGNCDHFFVFNFNAESLGICMTKKSKNWYKRRCHFTQAQLGVVVYQVNSGHEKDRRGKTEGREERIAADMRVWVIRTQQKIATPV